MPVKTPPPRGDQATVADRDFYRKSMLDYVLDDANRLRDRVASADRRKLDQYLTGVREVERRVQQAAPALQCIGSFLPTSKCLGYFAPRG